MASLISAGTTSGTALNMSGDTSGVLQLATNGTTTAVTIGTDQNTTFAGSVKTNTLTSAASTALTLQSAGTTAITVDTSQNVKVANSTAVSGTNNVGNILCSNDISTGSFLMGVNGSFLGRQSSDGSTILNTGQANIIFSNGTYGSTTERMRIASDGKILAGTTTSPGSALLACNSGSNYWQYGASTTGSSIFWVLNSGGTGVSLTSGNTSWAAQSDERTKDIIEPISNALNKVNSLRSVIGKYKTDKEGIRRSFLIAQDVQAVLPEVIDTDTDEQGTMSIRYTEVIPLLVAAIKEQQALITAQAETINALTARIVALEAK